MEKCVFCGLESPTIGHHLIPKCKSGTTIVQSCFTCENFIHSTWSHNLLRDVYNTVDLIKQSEQFIKFLKWRLKQPVTSTFKSNKGKFRERGKYR